MSSPRFNKVNQSAAISWVKYRLGLIEKEYNWLRRDKGDHKQDIKRLREKEIPGLEKFHQNDSSETVLFQFIMQLEDIYRAKEKAWEQSKSWCFWRRGTFTQELNRSVNDHHYTRMIALTLKELYQNIPAVKPVDSIVKVQNAGQYRLGQSLKNWAERAVSTEKKWGAGLWKKPSGLLSLATNGHNSSHSARPNKK